MLSVLSTFRGGAYNVAPQRAKCLHTPKERPRAGGFPQAGGGFRVLRLSACLFCCGYGHGGGRISTHAGGSFSFGRCLYCLRFSCRGVSSVFVCVASTRRAYVIAPPSGLVVFSPQKRVFPPRKRGLFPQKRAFLQLKRAFLLQKLFRRVEAFPRVHVRTAGGVVDYKQRRRGVSFGRVVSTDARALWSLPSSVRLIWLSIRYQVVTVWCTIW